MDGRKYIALFLATVVTSLSAVTLFNYYVDPFTYYHRPWTPINLSKNQRYANPGLARNYPYELAMVGTSHIMEISSSRMTEIFEKPSINLPFTAGLVREMAVLTKLVLEQDKADMIYFEMNFPSFALGDEVSSEPDEFPMFLYEPRMEMPFRYLMSFDTLFKSLEAIDEPGKVTLENKDDVGKRVYGTERVVSIWNHQVHTWDERRLAFWEKHQKDIESPREILEARLEPLFRARPDVRFQLFLPPNSILLFLHHAMLSADDLERWLQFRNLLGQLADRHPNVSLHDFQVDFETMTDLDLYRDMGHYNPQILDRMIQRMALGEARVDAAAVRRNSDNLRREVMHFGRDFCARAGVDCPAHLLELLGGP